jgi:cellobiose transport system permease protein
MTLTAPSGAPGRRDPGAPAASAGRGRRNRLVRPARTGGSQQRLGPVYLAITPFFALFGVFVLVPVVFSIWLSFQKYSVLGGIGGSEFVGLRNFEFLVQDATFRRAIVNSLLIWVLGTFPMLAMALVVAAMINSVTRLKSFYRLAYFLPNVTSIVAVTLFFGALFSEQFGLINQALAGLGLSGVPWLTDPWAMKVVVATLITWQWCGYNAILYLAGMQAIPAEVYEAAALDGAGPVRQFWSVTLPLLRPVVLFTTVISTITTLQTFTEPQVLFGSNTAVNPNSGGPGQGALTMVLYFYQQAFNNNDYGYGAAIAMGVFAVVLVFVVINFRLARTGDDR